MKTRKMAAVLNGAKGRNLADWNWRIRWVTSRTDRMDSSDVSLTIAMNSFASGGVTMRNAYGTMTRLAECHLESPRLRAASTWPRGMASSSERKISAIYAE